MNDEGLEREILIDVAMGYEFADTVITGGQVVNVHTGTIHADGIAVKGQGVPQDYVQAHMWFNLAASRVTGEKHKDYSNARDRVAKRMSSRQVSEAQRLAREWKPKKE